MMSFWIPSSIKTDGGIPFNGQQFDKFAKNMGFEQKKTTSYHSRSNGLVESFMKKLTEATKIAKKDMCHIRTKFSVP